jgi:hypothetical protein
MALLKAVLVQLTVQMTLLTTVFSSAKTANGFIDSSF